MSDASNVRPKQLTLASRVVQALAGPSLAVAISFGIGGVLVLALGRNPLEVYGVLLPGAFSGWPNISVTLQ